MKIHTFQHVSFEGLGMIEDWVKRKGHLLSRTCFFQDFQLPKMEEVDCLIVMGGPMSVHDESTYSWIKKEKQFIRKAIENGKIVLGICLGAQLIADALGAKVYKNQHKEIGWFPVRFIKNSGQTGNDEFFPEAMTVFHWHGETFDLPQGAFRIAESEGCRNQGFVYKNNVIGLQFHIESTPQTVKEIVKNCGDELVGGEYVQNKDEILSQKNWFQPMNNVMKKLLKKHLGEKYEH